MDYLFCIKRKPSKGCPDLNEALITTISSNNVIAFTTQTEIEDNSIRSYGSHVYVADLNTPWLSHKILSNACLVTVLQWDSTGELLLMADESGSIQIYQMKEHVLNEWNLKWQTSLHGEHILSAAFFHSGKKTCLNPEKKDSLFYNEKFQNVKFACSVKQFGSRPATGALLLTSTGLLAAIIIPHYTSQAPMIVATESLGPTRIYIKTADICYGKNGHFLLAVSSGDISMPIQCYKVSVRKSEDKCVITSETLPSFFLSEGSKEVIMEVFLKDRRYADLLNLNWVMKEDADSLVVAVGNDSGSCLQVWELREKALPVHEVLADTGEPKFFNTVLWQFQCSFQYGHKVMSLATSKMTFLNTLSSSYIVVAFADNSIHCLYRDTLKSICNITLGNLPSEEHFSKYSRSSHRIHTIDMSWLGNVLIVIDADSYIHVFKLPPQIESSTPLSVPYATTMLEYCLMTGLDWLDLLLVLRSGMLDPLCDRFTESFNRQPSSIQQYYYIKYMCIKASLYRLSLQGQSKANDLIQYLMLHSIATSFKSLLRPSEQCSPGDSLSITAEGQNDVDKVLMHLEAKEFTVEPSTLQSLQQLIQWVSDLALNLLVKLPDSRPSVAKSYELLRDIKAINTLREMLVLIRIWGLLRPACLPVFNKSDFNLDVLALIFRLLSKLVQNVSEPEDSLIDECCLLPSQVQVQQLQLQNNRVVLASHQMFQQLLPLSLEFNVEPECLISSNDSFYGQTVDSIRHVFLGRSPRCIKQCVRCGSSAGIVPVTRTAAIRAWDQRWSKSCLCGGHWRVQITHG
ncbi:PREDICTED: mediator of RNA polymerase II transcription subunit 16 isoform X2 [Nicrophorus vespilloides]|uniref:Mediator of RNA polymerase II transcription subunit 16 n=1 Tax=Nicrophorus vespilloides TaxID=110193 RepID=A0ABM1NA60_NICVS|nr:PREDICTED: mediator of RNA polymerase II transcription subunit 16 isoform X2 [Nicrophorus vespilloides]